MDSKSQEILKKLQDNNGVFISGEALAEALKISRPGIWKHINKLKKIGYEIQSRSGLGYRLEAVPDSVSREEVLPCLKTRWLGQSYHYLKTVGSTNDYALVLAAEGASHGTVVVADEQTRGRGRLTREWVSTQNLGIYISILLKDILPIRIAAQSTHIVSLALVKMLKDEFGIDATIKWPNDVLIKGRKVAGILTEVQSDQEFSRFSVIGVGINVNHGRAEMQGPFRYPATSIALETGYSVKRQRALGQFLTKFEQCYDRFIEEGLGPLIPEIESFSEVVGKTITVASGDRKITGKAHSYTMDGALLLIKEDGSLETIWAGDVTHVAGML